MKQKLSERLANIQLNSEYGVSGPGVDAEANTTDESECKMMEQNAALENVPIAHGVKPTDVAAMLHMRKAKKAINARKPAVPAESVVESVNISVPKMPTTGPLVPALPKHAPKHLADSTPIAEQVAANREMDDEERQYEIDSQRGFRVINRRVRSRDELLNMPLDELNVSIDTDKLTKHSIPRHLALPTDSGESERVSAKAISADTETISEVATVEPIPSIIDMYYAALAESEREEATQAGKIPPMSDHEPTVHLDNTAEKISLKDALLNPFAYLASQLDAARVIMRNKQEKNDPTGEHTAKRDKIIKRTLGAVGVGLAGVVIWKLGYDMGIADGVNTSIPFGSEHEVNRYPDAAAIAATEEAARQAAIAAHNEAILDSPVHIIPVAGGGDAYALANGADTSLWRQNQAEFLQLFPNESYLMSDGNVGFDRPGELSDAAKEYWSKKFGQWR